MAQSIEDLNAITAANMALDDVREHGDVSASESKKATMQEDAKFFLFQNNVVNVKHYGATGDGVTDDYAAIVAAIDSATSNAGGNSWVSAGMAPVIYFPPGNYKCSQAINLKKPVYFRGDGCGIGYRNAYTILRFSGTVGIYINNPFTDLGVPITPATTGADGTIIEGIAIFGDGTGSSATLGGSHGIVSTARCIIRDVHVSNFAGIGILIYADVEADPPSGNANGWQVRDTAIGYCGSHGFHCSGGDANAGTCFNVDVAEIGGYGFYDNSFLGNTYIGCQAAVIGLGSYKCDGVSARSVFISCYDEGGSPPSDVRWPSMFIGGMFGSGFSTTSAGIVGFNTMDIIPVANIPMLILGERADLYSFNSIIKFRDTQNTDGTGYYWHFCKTTGRHGYSWSADVYPNYFMFYDQGATTGNGYARTISTAGIGISEYYFGSPGQMQYRTLSSAMPTTGSYIVGDYVENSAPSELGSGGSKYIIMGWKRLTTGSNHVLNTDWVQCRCLTGN